MKKSGATHGLARVNDLRRNFRSAANAKFHRRSQESELRSQELQNMRARSLSENPGQASARENLRRNPRFFSSPGRASRYRLAPPQSRTSPIKAYGSSG